MVLLLVPTKILTDCHTSLYKKLKIKLYKGTQLQTRFSKNGIINKNSSVKKYKIKTKYQCI